MKLFLPLLLFPLWLSAQQTPNWSLGIEFQAYPTGILPGIQVERMLSEKHALHLRAGYNALDHRDLGVQDNEQGGGFGGTLGYHYYFKGDARGWYAGARSDVWFNRVDWENTNELGILERGTTKLVVVQPTAEAGYSFTPGAGNWFIRPSVAFGVEVNVVTKGAETGQGTILLLGLSAGRRW